MKKKALITGITGQDGSYLSELLLEKGYEVYGMVRRASVERFDRIAHIQDRINLVQGDLTLDKALWLMGDQPPARCFGLGGRQVRQEPKWGHIYDHFAVCYEWPNGVRTFAYTRQMAGCHNEVEDFVFGTKGKAEILKNEVTGANKWRYRGDKPSMYDQEHRELFAGIRAGNIINNGIYMSYSTLLAIMGREACYSGQLISWDEALNSPQNLTPARYEWGDVETPQVSMPGLSKPA